MARRHGRGRIKRRSHSGLGRVVREREMKAPRIGPHICKEVLLDCSSPKCDVVKVTETVWVSLTGSSFSRNRNVALIRTGWVRGQMPVVLNYWLHGRYLEFVKFH